MLVQKKLQDAKQIQNYEHFTCNAYGLESYTWLTFSSKTWHSRITVNSLYTTVIVGTGTKFAS